MKQKPKNMSNGKGKGKQKTQAQAGNVAGDGQFHYFSIQTVKNPDGTILVKWGVLNELPAGEIVKNFDVNKHSGDWDEGSGGAGGNSSSTYLGAPYGIGPNQAEDVRNSPDWRWEILDASQNAPGSAIKYNITGSKGVPNDVSSGDPVGSEVLTVNF